MLHLLVFTTFSDLPRKPSKSFGNLRRSLEIFGKYSDTFVWPSDSIRRIFGKWSELFGKSSETSSLVCIKLGKVIHDCLEIWNFPSRLFLHISLVRCTHKWGIEMNTRRAFLYLRALTYYSIYKVNRNSTVCISIFPLKIPCQEGKESMAMKELFKVLKDHSNRFMQELVSSSFQHCFLSEVESILEDPDSMDIQECGTENVVRYVSFTLHSGLCCLKPLQKFNTLT